MALETASTSARRIPVRRVGSPVLLAGALVSSALGLAACDGESAQYTARPQPVRAATVKLTAPSQTRTYTGTIEPRYESDLGFRVSGKITERFINIGDKVTPGMVLAQLDDTDYRLSLESAEAELRAAESSLAQAVADERRYAELNKKSWVSDASYDQKKAAADEARGRMERARRSLSLAHNQLSYTSLRANETGVVTALPVEVGQVITAGQLIARVARLDELEAVVSIPESRIDSDRNAKSAVTLWASPDRVYAAKLREVSPQADPATRTFKARYSILTPDAGISLGKTATVHLTQVGSGTEARLPLAAVFKDGGQPSVWVIDEVESRLVKKSVEVGSWTETSAIVTSGLQSGEKVVAAGVHKVDPGLAVRVIEAAQ